MPVVSRSSNRFACLFASWAVAMSAGFTLGAEWTPTRSASRPDGSASRAADDSALPPWQRNPNFGDAQYAAGAVRPVQAQAPIGRTAATAGGTHGRLSYDVPLQPGEQLVGAPTITEMPTAKTAARIPVASYDNRVRMTAAQRSPTVAQREVLPTPGPVHPAPYVQGEAPHAPGHFHDHGQGDVVHEGEYDFAPDFEFENGYGGSGGCVSCNSCVDGDCGGCGSCNGGYGPLWPDAWGNPLPCPECGRCGYHQLGCGHVGRCLHNCLGPFFREWSIFAGTQGFKGPADLGVSGNFGFCEGFNAAGPIIPYPRIGLGYQAGVQWTQSDLSGTPFNSASRGQTFYTFGVFHRAYRGFGLQGGIVYDGLDDDYYADMRIGQVRTELSFLTGCGNEFGFQGTFGVKNDDNHAVVNPLLLRLGNFTPTDRYTAFYRRTMCSGGQGRLSIGVTGQDLLLLGVDFRAPISNRCELIGGFTYIVPENGNENNGQMDESWNVGMNLVCYFARSRCGTHNTPFRPLFNVADNGAIMFETR